MNREELINTLELMKAEVEWEQHLTYAVAIDEAIKCINSLWYRVDKMVDNEWFIWGVYETLEQAANACFELGKANVDDCRVTMIKLKEND